jgi:predicted transcriptional regulator of viral defense system
MPTAELIDVLASRGTYHFTTKEAAALLGSSLVAARAALRRLQRKGIIATPYRGFHVIVPPEYRSLGCLPADQFVPQLMELLGLDYYAALLTAGRYHGAAHQQPQIFQVMVAKNRPGIACGDIRVAFVARRNVADVPKARFNTPRGHLAVSTPEATAFDLVGYPQHAGGLDNVATVVAELAEVLDSEVLASLAPLSPVPWAQRLGYLLERVGAAEKAEPLSRYVAEEVNETTALVPSAPAEGAPAHPRWRLLVNVQVEPDL